jgi:hypothetical protein
MPNRRTYVTRHRRLQLTPVKPPPMGKAAEDTRRKVKGPAAARTPPRAPACSAAPANAGHRSRHTAVSRSSARTGPPMPKAAWHGPSPSSSCNCSAPLAEGVTGIAHLLRRAGHHRHAHTLQVGEMRHARPAQLVHVGPCAATSRATRGHRPSLSITTTAGPAHAHTPIGHHDGNLRTRFPQGRSVTRGARMTPTPKPSVRSMTRRTSVMSACSPS